MKTVFSNHELPHVWAKQSQLNGRGHSIYFIGKDIFSYGSHFCIAHIFDGQHVFFTTRSYSSSTSKHLSYTRDAVRHFQIINVPFPNLSFFEDADRGHSNASYWQVMLSNELSDANNSRKRPENRERAKLNALSIIQDIEVFTALIGESLNKKQKNTDHERVRKILIITIAKAKNEMSIEQYNEQLDRISKNEKANETRRKREQQKKLLTKVDAWIAGNERSDAIHELTKIYLRHYRMDDRPDILQTSHGAQVSLRRAKILFDHIRKGRDVKGFDLDGYKVISINGVLKIGCHEIERSEIERFASSQGWI